MELSHIAVHTHHAGVSRAWTVSPVGSGVARVRSGPVGERPERWAAYRVAAEVRVGEDDRYAAVVSILRRDLPRLADRPAGTPVIPGGAETLAGTIGALLALDGSYLLVQGPPGEIGRASCRERVCQYV